MAQFRYEFENRRGGSEPLSRADPSPGPSRRHLSSSDLSILTSRLHAVSVQSRRLNPSTPPPLPSPARSFFASSQLTHTSASTSTLAELANLSGSPHELDELSHDLALSQDIDTIIELAIPAWTTPSHPLAPITVSHKLKFSAFISNPDGHTSELRCALPLHILAPHLAPEAALASGGARTLLFGPSGTLAPGASAQAELPSYPEHVRDRLAPLYSSSAPCPELIPAPWASLASTPAGTPPTSRPTSPTTGYFPPLNSSADSELARSLTHSPRASSSHSRVSSPGTPAIPESSPQAPLSNASGSSNPSTSQHHGFFHIHLPKPRLRRPPKALTAMRSSQSLTSPPAPTTPEDERELLSR